MIEIISQITIPQPFAEAMALGAVSGIGYLISTQNKIRERLIAIETLLKTLPCQSKDHKCPHEKSH